MKWLIYTLIMDNQAQSSAVNQPIANQSVVGETGGSSSNSSSSSNMSSSGSNKDEGSQLYTYIFIAVLSVALIVLLYYAYSRFTINAKGEKFTKGTEQERDDPVIDFNLREAIRELQGLQTKVLSTLSENSTF